MYRVWPHTAIMGLTRARGLSSLLLMSTPCRVAGEYSSSLSLPPSWYVLMACNDHMICQMANNCARMKQLYGGPWRGVTCQLLVMTALDTGMPLQAYPRPLQLRGIASLDALRRATVTFRTA